MTNNIQNYPNIDLIKNNLIQINEEYLNQLNTLQQFYFSKIKDIQNQIINLIDFNNNNPNIKYSNNNNFQNNNLNTFPLNFNNLFEDIPLQFVNVIDIQNTKLTYEEREEQLEELMDNYTNQLEKYYNSIFEKCKLNGNNQNELNNISNEYKNNINKLNEIYETKQSILENNFFATLKILTAKKDKIY